MRGEAIARFYFKKVLTATYHEPFAVILKHGRRTRMGSSQAVNDGTQETTDTVGTKLAQIEPTPQTPTGEIKIQHYLTSFGGNPS